MNPNVDDIIKIDKIKILEDYIMLNNIKLEVVLILLDENKIIDLIQYYCFKNKISTVLSKPNYSLEFLIELCNNNVVNTIIGSKSNIKLLNNLQWESESIENIICIDCINFALEHEENENRLMDKKLWEFVGINSKNAIEGGGWINSYTREYFTEKEVKECIDNTYDKLSSYLFHKPKILEIGCASGLTMYKLSPFATQYFGIDMSETIIEKNKGIIRKNKIDNIKLACLSAHEINLLSETNFNIVILNSVIQCFNGHNYLRQVIKKIINIMSGEGVIYIGDVMDLDKKVELVKSLEDFKNKNPKYDTKTDFSHELFLSTGFFYDLPFDFPQIKTVEITNKNFTIENELTKYRYDVTLLIDKVNFHKGVSVPKKKKQYAIDIS